MTPDAVARHTRLVKLERTLTEHGVKAVIGKRGWTRFVKV